ncbi:NF-kappa-B-activating protein-like [Elysia marginata]|uniref:NF-kappa-B-activating protein-like n=1 Tax=Elysia marginata TaxID=1093978 RepID=A0AAV4EN13_9GAST|nr:NF-kappa-B-activating protein-like [Elysia marginata]
MTFIFVFVATDIPYVSSPVYKPNPNLSTIESQLLDFNTYPSRDPRLQPPSKRERGENRKKDNLKSRAGRTIRIVKDIPLEPVENFNKHNGFHFKPEFPVNATNLVEEKTTALPKQDVYRSDAVNSQETKSAEGSQNAIKQETGTKTTFEPSSSKKEKVPTTQLTCNIVEANDNVMDSQTSFNTEAVAGTVSQEQTEADENQLSEDNIELELSKLLDEGESFCHESDPKPLTESNTLMSANIDKSNRADSCSADYSGDSVEILGPKDAVELKLIFKGTSSNIEGNKAFNSQETKSAEGSQNVNLSNHLDMPLEESDKLTSVCRKVVGVAVENQAMVKKVPQEFETHRDILFDKSDRDIHQQETKSRKCLGISISTKIAQSDSSPINVSEHIEIETSEVCNFKAYTETNFEMAPIESLTTVRDSTQEAARKASENNPILDPKQDTMVSVVNYTDYSGDSVEITGANNDVEIKMNLKEVSSNIEGNSALSSRSSVASCTRQKNPKATEQKMLINKSQDCILITENKVDCTSDLDLSDGEILSSPDSVSHTSLLSDSNIEDKQISRSFSHYAYCAEKSISRTSNAGSLRKLNKPNLEDSPPMCRNYCKQQHFSPTHPHILSQDSQQHMHKPFLQKLDSQASGKDRNSGKPLAPVFNSFSKIKTEDNNTGNTWGYSQARSKHEDVIIVEDITPPKSGPGWELRTGTALSEWPQECVRSPSLGHDKPSRCLKSLATGHSKSRALQSPNRSKSSQSPRSHSESRLLTSQVGSQSPRSYSRSRSPTCCIGSRSPPSHNRPNSSRSLISRVGSLSPRFLIKSKVVKKHKKSKKRKHKRSAKSHTTSASLSKLRGPNSPKSHGRSRSQRICRSSKSPRKHRSRSSRNHRRSRSPRMHRRSRSTGMHTRSRSPRMHRRSRSPRMHRRSRSPRMHRRSRSPRMHRRSRSPRKHTRSRSPRMHTRPRSPRMHTRSTSPIILIRSTSPRMNTRSNLNEFSKPFKSRRCDIEPWPSQEKRVNPCTSDKMSEKPQLYKGQECNSYFTRSPHKKIPPACSSQRCEISTSPDFSDYCNELTEFSYQGQNLSNRHKYCSPAVSASPEKHESSSPLRNYSEKFSQVESCKRVSKQVSKHAVNTDQQHISLPALPSCSSAVLCGSHRNQETNTAYPRQDSPKQESKQVLEKAKNTDQQRTSSPVSPSQVGVVLSRIRKNLEIGLIKSNQFSVNGRLYSDRPIERVKSKSAENLKWPPKKRQRSCGMKRHFSDSARPSEKSSSLSGKSLSGVVMSTTQPLLKSKPLSEMLGLMEKQAKNGSKWILEVHKVHIKSLCDLRDAKRCDQREYDEMERCLSLIYDYEHKGLVRMVQDCECILKSDWSLRATAKCLMSRRKLDEAPIILSDISSSGSSQSSLLLENPGLRFADMTSIFSIINQN